MIGKIALALAAVALLAVPLWASDRITLAGERTLYSVKCERGNWQGTNCSGKLAPSERYAFRASHTRQEVVHWIRGSTQQSGLYSHCSVTDRDNWKCDTRPDEKPSVTHELERGRPPADVPLAADTVHGVSKWKWMTMKIGLGSFTSADY